MTKNFTTIMLLSLILLSLIGAPGRIQAAPVLGVPSLPCEDLRLPELLLKGIKGKLGVGFKVKALMIRENLDNPTTSTRCEAALAIKPPKGYKYRQKVLFTIFDEN